MILRNYLNDINFSKNFQKYIKIKIIKSYYKNKIINI